MDADARRHLRAKALFIQVLDMPEADGRAWLNEQCGEDAELRGEVLSLLGYHSDKTVTPQSSTNTARELADTVRDGLLRSARATGRSSGIPGTLRVRGKLRRVLSRAQKFRVALGVAAVIVAIAFTGRWTHRRVTESLVDVRTRSLEEIAEARAAALDLWVGDELARPGRLLAIPEVAGHVQRALAAPRTDEGVAELRVLNERLGELVDGQLDNDGVVLLDRTGRVVQSRYHPESIGRDSNAKRMGYALRAFSGENVFVPPQVPRNDTKPRVWFLTPVRGDDGRVQGALAVGQFADEGFAAILDRLNDEGETSSYAFDLEGRPVSELSNVEALKKGGALPMDAESTVLSVGIRDPGGDVSAGFETTGSPESWPLTRLAAIALAADKRRGSGDVGAEADHGVIREAYRDYRGIPVLGAWRWLDEYDIGVAVEVDESVALAPTRYVGNAFIALVMLLGGALVGLAISSFWLLRMRRRADDAERLGPYHLGEKIGEGGMGKVYLAEHALLKRPTAIKLLKGKGQDDLDRFEREVRLASQLTHPNTIAIYDFGHTETGSFYYAMEFLTGLTLEDAVAADGPMAPARVVHILRQICGSLREAHQLGLIHRDIKPLNIMLCTRAGEHDVVKVLDFGLVKDTRDLMSEATRTEELRGSPRYMAPERLTDPRHVDSRADIYAVGAVAYFLLAGVPAHDGATALDVLEQVRRGEPVPVQERAGGTIPASLAHAVMQCLEQRAEDRPRDVCELLRLLG